MPNAFTVFATSRFVDREAVVAALRECAERLKGEHDEIVAVHLFGSFASGDATPRSDADVVVEVTGADPALRQRVWEAAQTAFLDAPVPADIFVISSERMARGMQPRQGVAGAVAREGVRLG